MDPKDKKLIKNIKKEIEWRRKGPSGLGIISVNWLKEAIKESGVSLDQFGTSEEELLRFEKEAYGKDARLYLKFLRDGSKHPATHFDWLKNCVNKGHLELTYIGTTEQEIFLLQKRYKMTQSESSGPYSFK